MRADEAERELSPAAGELVKLVREEVGEMSARQRMEGFLELNARRSPSGRRRHYFLSFAAALAVVTLGFVGYRASGTHDSVALSYAVEGGRTDSSGNVEPNGRAEPTLRFSDGTEVVFLGGARGRVKSVGEHGARIAMSGKVDVKVVHWRGSHWLFDAGPFLITVTGTAFTAEWREKDERLEVALRSGAIAVSGPVSDEAIALRAGQRLVISTRDKEVLIRALDSKVAEVRPSRTDDRVAVGPTQTAPAEEAAPLANSAALAPPSASAVPVRWTTELAAGHFSTILTQAEQRGLDKVIAEVSSDELAALADAARYSRREDVARKALTGQRRRFPQSARANDAAFLLGRLEEAADHHELALDWYERCLNESPHGAYTSEALGRKMTLVQRLRGPARARPIAEEYLRRFESGTYAAAARAVLRAP